MLPTQYGYFTSARLMKPHRDYQLSITFYPKTPNADLFRHLMARALQVSHLVEPLLEKNEVLINGILDFGGVLVLILIALSSTEDGPL